MLTRLTSPYTSALLEGLQVQNKRNDCGPCTVATAIRALTGQEVEGLQISREMNRPAWRGPLPVIRRIPNWATFPWGMVDVFRRYGLQASWRPFASTERLLSLLEGGCVLLPIIGGWRPPWVHVMTLVEYEPRHGWGFVNTQRPERCIYWLEDSTFRRQWLAMGRLLVQVIPPHAAQN